MKSFDELLKSLYNNCLKEVADEYSDFSLYERLEEYMHGKYGKLLEKISRDDILLEKFLADWYNTELRHWGRFTSAQKYSYFIPDKYLIEMDRLSSEIFSLAKKMATNTPISDDEINQNSIRIEQMQQLLVKVRTENTAFAQQLISESIVDADYVAKKTTNISIRLSKLLRYGKIGG